MFYAFDFPYSIYVCVFNIIRRRQTEGHNITCAQLKRLNNLTAMGTVKIWKQIDIWTTAVIILKF